MACHSGLDPESSFPWIPAFAGMTPFAAIYGAVYKTDLINRLCGGKIKIRQQSVLLDGERCSKICKSLFRICVIVIWNLCNHLQ